MFCFNRLLVSIKDKNSTVLNIGFHCQRETEEGGAGIAKSYENQLLPYGAVMAIQAFSHCTLPLGFFASRRPHIKNIKAANPRSTPRVTIAPMTPATAKDI